MTVAEAIVALQKMPPSAKFTEGAGDEVLGFACIPDYAGGLEVYCETEQALCAGCDQPSTKLDDEWLCPDCQPKTLPSFAE